MSLPTNFGKPGEELHRFFRNTCIEFKKLVHSTRDIDLLQEEMQKFIDVSRQMDWHHKTTGVYHKDEGEKLADKVYAEFKRYIEALQETPEQANPSDLLLTLDLMEQMVNSFKVT